MTNADFEKYLDTSDQWIVERTRHPGTAHRRADESLAGFCQEASERAMAQGGITAMEIDAIILGTVSPDRRLPATACDLQALLGARRAAAFDISAACPGWIYALAIAEGLIVAGRASNVLAIGAEKLSTITDWNDRSTAVLFGDGAGAALVQPAGATVAGCSPSYSGRTESWPICSTSRVGAPPIPSAARWSRSAPTTSAWRDARSTKRRCSPWREPATRRWPRRG
jgi:3-oxoacyl-(acyl-carrier-protein) synthase III